MRFFIDQCVPKSAVDYIENLGHTAFVLKDHLPTNANDDLVIEKAGELNALLISLNGDFADIITYPPNQYGGIIALQVRNRPEALDDILDRLKEYFGSNPKREDYIGKLIVVEPHRIRVRR